MLKTVYPVKYLPLAILAFAGFSTTAQAMILGDVQLASRLGQPLEGTIDVFASPGEQLFAECFQMNGSEVAVHMRYFGDFKSGKILVTSKTRVREPLLNLRLTVDCPELPATIREFAVFLDPPKADRPRLAETRPLLEDPKPLRTNVEPVLMESPNSVAENLRPPEKTPNVQAVAVEKLPPITVADTAPVTTLTADRFKLKLSSELSHTSRVLIQRSERVAVPKTEDRVKPASANRPKGAIDSDKIAAKSPYDNTVRPESNSNSMFWIAALLIGLVLVAWQYSVRRTTVLHKPVTREAVDWLSKEPGKDVKDAASQTQATTRIENIDFEVQDLTAKSKLQDKGGHTIELDHETTRQLEESYLKELRALSIANDDS